MLFIERSTMNTFLSSLLFVFLLLSQLAYSQTKDAHWSCEAETMSSEGDPFPLTSQQNFDFVLANNQIRNFNYFFADTIEYNEISGDTIKLTILNKKNAEPSNKSLKTDFEINTRNHYFSYWYHGNQTGYTKVYFVTGNCQLL